MITSVIAIISTAQTGAHDTTELHALPSIDLTNRAQAGAGPTRNDFSRALRDKHAHPNCASLNWPARTCQVNPVSGKQTFAVKITPYTLSSHASGGKVQPHTVELSCGIVNVAIECNDGSILWASDTRIGEANGTVTCSQGFHNTRLYNYDFLTGATKRRDSSFMTSNTETNVEATFTAARWQE